MAEKSYADIKNENELKKLERKVASEYKKAWLEVEKKIKDYYKSFERLEAVKRKRFENGYITEEEFNEWRRNKMAIGKRWETIRDDIVNRMIEADVVASAYINDTTPNIYSLNANYTAFRVESYATDISFTLLNERAISNLIQGSNQTTFRVVNPNRVKSYAWNVEKIQSALVTGLLLGESVKDIAKRFYKIMGSNWKAAVRNARTACTSAACAGRVHTIEKAQEMGIEIEKEWMATADERTRNSHLLMSGIHVKVDKPFPNGLMYPADPNGEPAEVYNCRCTLVDYLPNITRKTNTDGKAFEEWMRRKKKDEDEEARRNRWNEYH